MMSEPIFVYVTTSSTDEAEEIGKMMVEQRLAACANILPGMQSVYRWEEKIQTDQEVVLILKTVKANLSALTEAVVEVHSYDEPCVVALPIIGGSPTFLQWIANEANPKKSN